MLPNKGEVSLLLLCLTLSLESMLIKAVVLKPVVKIVNSRDLDPTASDLGKRDGATEPHKSQEKYCFN